MLVMERWKFKFLWNYKIYVALKETNDNVKTKVKINTLINDIYYAFEL